MVKFLAGRHEGLSVRARGVERSIEPRSAESSSLRVNRVEWRAGGGRRRADVFRRIALEPELQARAVELE
jgi:hypothetical protein